MADMYPDELYAALHRATEVAFAGLPPVPVAGLTPEPTFDNLARWQRLALHLTEAHRAAPERDTVAYAPLDELLSQAIPTLIAGYCHACARVTASEQGLTPGLTASLAGALLAQVQARGERMSWEEVLHG